MIYKLQGSLVEWQGGRERESVCVCVRVCVRARMCTWGACMPAQLCPTLYNPVDYSPPGISVHGIS